MSLAQAGDDIWEKLAQEAAFLHAVCRLQQGEIGKKLGCSQSHVSRLLERAKAKGWLKTEIRFVDTGISPERMEELRRSLESVELTKALRKLKSAAGMQISVFESGSDSTDHTEYKLRLKRFSPAAASRVKELLRHAKVVGIAWGQTLGSLVEEFVSSGIHLPQGLELQFVPVCPQVVRVGYPQEYSSSGLVERLNRIVGNEEEKQLSLTGVPAYIPRCRVSQHRLQKSLTT